MVSQNNDIKVAIIGMAWTTALGNELDIVWQQLLNGKSGIYPLPSRHLLRNELAASVLRSSQELTPGEHLYTMTLNTIQNTLKDACLENKTSNIILIIGTSFGARLDDKSVSQLKLHDWVDNLAAELGLESIALSTACSSASDAILMGSALIKSGYADVCICGGADILGDSKRLAHSALGTMSPTTLRSFDRQRDGTILGEGAGFLVLKRHSKDINKKIYAFLSGCGSANDASGLTAPDKLGNGIKLAIGRSLNDAKIEPSKINLINAHGSGTLTNDVVEATAYKQIFIDNMPTIFATKGAFGHTLGATGALEAIASIMALRDQMVPPINNLSDPLEIESLRFPIQKAMPIQAKYGLSLTIGFGGFNTSLIFEGIS